MTGEPVSVSVRHRIDDTETPVSAILKLGTDRAGLILFESVVGGESRGRYSFIGLDPDRWWRVRNGVAQVATDREFTDVVEESREPINSLRKFVDSCETSVDRALPPMATGAFGYVGYDMVRYMERLPQNEPDPIGTPEALLMRPTVVMIFDAVKQEIILVSPHHAGSDAAESRLDEIERLLEQPPPAARPVPIEAEEIDFVSNLKPATYRSMVEKAKAYIKAGDIFQVVPSQRFSAPFARKPFSFYRALRRLNPSPFMFFANFGDFQVSGASPEILVRVRDGDVTVRPIAGTLPRGKSQQEDLDNEERLLADPKERAEHLMLLDLGRNDVGRVAAARSVKVTEQFKVERYSHVMHIVSNVVGRLKDNEDMVSAMCAGFPAGTVSGAPKIRAMEIISELEPHGRGVYAGAVGYFGAHGNMDTCIALRTAVFKDEQIHVQAGGGVVYDSDPQKEFEETVHKASAVFRAAAEAARYDGGGNS